MRRYFTLLILFSLVASAAFATHNRAGEITYKHVSGNTYQFIVYTYTKSSSLADRPWLPVDWGDGSPADSLERVDIISLGNDSQKNVYIKNHTYPGSGEYEICIVDPNRVADILNINNGGSVDVLFSIQTVLKIGAAFRPNNSVFFTNSDLQDACIWQPWVFNIGAVDEDGDSLAFKLIPSSGDNCVQFPLGFYEYPNEVEPTATNPPNPNMNLSIDINNGTVIWDSPQRIGEYNLAFITEEWRDGFLIGTVIRDMQITVRDCDNLPPELAAIPDTCVEAGQTLVVPITADDPNDDNIEITGYGAPFALIEPYAEIQQSGQNPPVEAEFIWDTDCDHVRLDPYQAVIQAEDNGSGVSLVDVEIFNVTVIAPAPENLTAEPNNVSIDLNWEPSICSNAVGYKVYRRLDPYGFFPSFCETGVPEYTGYEFIADVNGVNNTSFTDVEIFFGRDVCYMVIAYFADGAESYASNEACAEVGFVIPIMKKNSVGVTSETVGVDTLRWRSPEDIDLDFFSGPYQYKLYRGDGFGVPDEMIYETAVVTDFEDLEAERTVTGLDTETQSNTYAVELFSNGVLVSTSNRASSLFLVNTPNDNEVLLEWEEEIPWVNFRYDIYRRAPGDTDFAFYDSTVEPNFLDTSLVNGLDYCYYVISYGSYGTDLENDTLINFSQEICSMPYDRTPPCPPVLMGDGDCELFTVDLEWTNPNLTCPETDDVTEYNLYYAPTENEELELIETLVGDHSTIIDFIFENSIAGCYAVTALDSLNTWPDGELVQNESELSNVVCFDNCPHYVLPNVITPNGDGRNDFFIPFPYRSVESIDMTIMNRWGSIVFQTTDPDILWDARNKQTGELVTDGVYFYTCTVNSIRLSGIDPVQLTGYVTVIVEGGNPTD